MSGVIRTIQSTGKGDRELELSEFCGPAGKGIMLQITQGFGGLNEPGFIQLTIGDVTMLISELNKWKNSFIEVD